MQLIEKSDRSLGNEGVALLFQIKKAAHEVPPRPRGLVREGLKLATHFHKYLPTHCRTCKVHAVKN